MSKALNEMASWLKKGQKLPEPQVPPIEIDNLAQPESGVQSKKDTAYSTRKGEPFDQVNFKVPQRLNVPKRLRMMAAKEDVSVLTILMRAVEMYEAEHHKRHGG